MGWFVIPADAGIQRLCLYLFILVFMTTLVSLDRSGMLISPSALDSGFRRNDGILVFLD
ncbi:MAG: hypothetical protein OXG62_05060 [Nitrospinae bacterium]|nr:hypothetical protein [Nitrospinota bacterium]